MTSIRPVRSLSALAILLAGALFVVRGLTPQFASGTVTLEHPVIALSAALIIAGIAWCAFVLILRKKAVSGRAMLGTYFLLGLVLRLIFFNSAPVYENDYKRYLWDGAVVASGENPYRFSPTEIFEAGKPGARSIPDLTWLAMKSNDAGYITAEINSPKLTTIYPPAAQAVFTAAYAIAPYKPWGLKLVFLFVEILGFIALIAGLRARNLSLGWSAAYWLNPVIIFTTYNGVHMDVLLVAPLMAAILWIGRHPFRAAIMLSLAAAIKIWPLLLAPVLFRGWRHRPLIYVEIAVLVGGLTLISLAPMLLTYKAEAGLTAYSANWTNSSFIFPGIREALEVLLESPDRIARYLIAIILTGLSLWLGFVKVQDESLIPTHLMILTAAFVFLSPTGYPWYFIWFFMFLPFALQHWSARGLALLSVGAAAYYARFKIGEAGHYDIYSNVLVPLEFGIPLLVLTWDGLKAKRHA